MTQKKQIHKKELLDSLMPGWPILPEMRILGKNWLEDRANIHAGALKGLTYIDEFFEWYNAKIEVNAKSFLENMASGKDLFRKTYLHPALEQKVKRIGEGRMILDVGCGTGDAVIPHLQDSQFYLGIDPSTVLLTYIHEHYGLPFIDKGDAPDRKIVRLGALPSSIPIDHTKETAFDELICSMTLPSVEEYKHSLKSMFSLLAPRAGYFIAMFNSDKKQHIDGFFDAVTYSDKKRTTGDFKLPSGNLLRQVTIHFHDCDEVYAELQSYSRAQTAYTVGGIFQIFEGITQD